MKVVLFCGGTGLRMREASETLPKPMVPLGNRPIIWHLMKYYAHHGHRDFIFCLGHKSQSFKEYFLNYNEFVSNDFVISDGGRTVELLRRDMADWRLTFLETGLDANIGERLLQARDHLRDEDLFLANYADGLTDCHLPTIVDLVRRRPGSVGAFMVARPSTSFHFVEADDDGTLVDERHEVVQCALGFGSRFIDLASGKVGAAAAQMFAIRKFFTGNMNGVACSLQHLQGSVGVVGFKVAIEGIDK
jgi:glucose-1-phosphate cytidylyltransferase